MRLFEWLRSRLVVCSTLHYLLMQTLYRLGLRGHYSGATHGRYTLEESVEYLRRVFGDYLSYGGLSPADLAGKRVLELGPGDNLGVALLFIAAGAEQVVCLDRFDSSRDLAKNRAIYRALLDTLDPSSRARASACVSAAGDILSPRIECRCGVAIEDAATLFAPQSFDLIISRAVLEHVFDVDKAWQAMDRLLASGGRMLHKIDFRCHSYYEDFHPLWFLTVPRWLWQMISSPDPTLNRQRRPVYQRLVREFGYRERILITHLATRKEELLPHRIKLESGVDYSDADWQRVEGIRPRLTATFKSLSTEDLLVSGIFLAAVKDGKANELLP